MAGRPATIASLNEISGRYAAILCDVWGVLHNGVRHFEPAAAALAAARERGLAVVLVTNAPRPHGGVEAQLASLAVPQAAWDRVVTSGDVTRELVSAGPRRVFHLGPDRDLSLYDGLDIDIVEEFEANSVVCTGLFDDETEAPEDYADMLQRMRARNLPMVCANPDIAHTPIYAAALKAASEMLGRELRRDEVLAIGDGMLTDIKGASDNGIDVLYVSGGIHARDYGHPDNPEPDELQAFLDRHGYHPVATMTKLR